MFPRAPRSTLFPYTTLFRSCGMKFAVGTCVRAASRTVVRVRQNAAGCLRARGNAPGVGAGAVINRCVSNRSEEHTSELQSQSNLVCRLLLEKKNQNHNKRPL